MKNGKSSLFAIILATLLSSRAYAVEAEVDVMDLDLDMNDYVVEDPRFFRPAEVNELLGDGSKAREVLGWEPETSFEELISMMVAADMRRLQAEHH